MKSYEIAHQGSRFVVKTHEESGSTVVSPPFHTHAAAQAYIDQQRTAAGGSAHNDLNKTNDTKVRSEEYEEIGRKYGFTAYEGKQYILTGVPSFAGVFGLGISADNYAADCIDTDGKKYTAYFEILEKDEENGVLADWDNASLVRRT